MDEEGKGRIYGYDPVGCVEELNQCSGGAGVTLMQSLLDNQVNDFIEPAMFCFSSGFLARQIVLLCSKIIENFAITQLCLLAVCFGLHLCVYKVWYTGYLISN